MACTVWHFVVDDATGELRRVPAIRWSAFRSGQMPIPEWAGREVRAIELVLEVNRRRFPDVERELRRVVEALSAAHELVDPIRKLELDANRFWVPIDAHVVRLAVATNLPVDEIEATLVP